MIELKVEGMTCASCVARVERASARKSGVEAAGVMSISSLFVVTNSLRLRRFRPTRPSAPAQTMRSDPNHWQSSAPTPTWLWRAR